jgi:hypothetical protein
MDTSYILFIYLLINNSVAKLYLSDNFSFNFDSIENFKEEYFLFLLNKIIFANFLLSCLCESNIDKINFLKNFIQENYKKAMEIKNINNNFDDKINIIMKKYNNILFYDETLLDVIKNTFILFYQNRNYKDFYKLFKAEILSISLVGAINFNIIGNKYIVSVDYNNRKINIDMHGDIINLIFFSETVNLNNISNMEKNIILTNFDSDIKKIEISGNIIGNNYFNNAKLKMYLDNNEIFTHFLENSEYYDFLLEILFSTINGSYQEIFDYYKNTKQKIKDLNLVAKLESLVNCVICDAYRKKNMEKKSKEISGNSKILYNTNIFWKCIDICDKEATFIGPLYTNTKEIKMTEESEEIICEIRDLIPKEGENYYLDFNKKYFAEIKL